MKPVRTGPPERKRPPITAGPAPELPEAVSSRWREHADLLRCPLCAKRVRFDGRTALVCARGHTFNLSARGYADFYTKKDPGAYGRTHFLHRRAFFEAGYYAHLRDAVLQEAASLSPVRGVVDAGCGEGYYTRALDSALSCPVLGFDLSREAVRLAASHGGRALYMTADLTAIPLRDQAVDLCLDLFTPANYKEFYRVLTHGGALLKLIPTENHLKELRACLKGHIRQEEYAAGRVAEYMKEQRFIVKKELRLEATLPLSDASREDLLAMTPLMFSVDRAEIDASHLTEITVSADMIVCMKE